MPDHAPPRRPGRPRHADPAGRHRLRLGHRLRPRHADPTGRHRRGLRRAALVSALVAAVTGCSTGGHHAARSPSTTGTLASGPATTSTTEAGAQFAASPYEWTRSSAAALAIGGGRSSTLAAVLAPQIGGSWQVFGSRSGADGTPVATVWSSTDGQSWTAAPLVPPPPGTQTGSGASGGGSRITGATQYKTTTVVVGSTGDGATQQAAAWLSTQPGTPFAAQTVPDSAGPSYMHLVAAGALGMFAAGTVDGRFAMWISTDGRAWSEATGAEKAIAGSPEARVNALLANGDNVYAAGSVQSGANLQPALWASADGLNWHLVASAQSSFSGPGDRTIYSLAPLGTGLVAVGAVNSGTGWTPASWISPDGQTWSLVSEDFPAVPGQHRSVYEGGTEGTAARSVTAVTTFVGSTEVVATGGGPDGQGVWISSDGLHWASLGLPAAAADSSTWRAEVTASTIDTTVVLDAEPGSPYLLTDHRPAASGSAGSAGAAPPQGGWSQPSADPARFGPVQPQAVPVSLRAASGQLRLSVDLVTRPQTIGPETIRSETLVSSDGRTWSPDTVPASGDPPTRPAIGALVAHIPTGWIAVASPATGWPEAWSSPTGAAWTTRGRLTIPPGPGGAPVASQATVNGVCTARSSSSTPAGAGTSSRATGYVVASVGAAASSQVSTSSGGTSGPVSTVVTRSAAAWATGTTTSWRDAPVNAGPPAGGAQSMSGCISSGPYLYAFGSATATNGAPQPAVWRSADGGTWARSPIGAFSPGTPGPIISLAPAGSIWLAAANPDPGADPVRQASNGNPGAGPAATAAGDAGVGPAPSLENGRVGLWLSLSGGSAWQALDTLTAPWLGGARSEVDLVGFAQAPARAAAGSTTSTTSTGSTGSTKSTNSTNSTTVTGSTTVTVPVVVGVVDGELAVWTGTAVL